MSKKSFKDSPTMQFLTPPDSGNSPAEEIIKAMRAGSAETAPKPAESAEAEAKPARIIKGAKKGVIITPPRPGVPELEFRPAPPTPVEYRALPDHDEARKRRVQLIMKPSIFNQVREIAHSRQQSINNLFEEIVALYLAAHGNNNRGGGK